MRIVNPKSVFLIGFCLFANAYAVTNPSLIDLGEKLFGDFRFSEYFFKASGGNPNFKISKGDSHLNFISTSKGNVISPFKGQAQSCTSCHMVDQGFSELGMRGYNDFSQTTKVPKRNIDNQTHTLRNTPTLVGVGSRYAQNRLSHYDGEFVDHSQTVLGNFTGRNMGWLKSEKETALKNITRVIREASGESSYKEDFENVFAVNVGNEDDQEIINYVVEAVTAYMNSLDFETDSSGEYIGSPYDKFLKLNGIDRGPKEDESIFEYRNRLRFELSYIHEPKLVPVEYYPTQKKSLGFGMEEFRGMQIFFNVKGDTTGNSQGMCLVCHVPPTFSDQFFHNIGNTQISYDAIHGAGSFAKLEIPSLQNRGKKFFLSRPKKENKNAVDLGVWNFYKRTKGTTEFINKSFCRDNPNCPEDRLADMMIARFKTTTVRNLGHSNPYFYNGSAKTIEDAVRHYKTVSDLMRKGELRNPAPQLRGISITEEDIKSLTAFLESLNENYE